MNARYILRETHDGRITPRPDFGLYASRHAAKKVARPLGLPLHLITAVRRSRHD